LHDISTVLSNTSWERTTRPSAIILHLFELIFGERHLSFRCIISSCVATVVFVSSAVLALGHFVHLHLDWLVPIDPFEGMLMAVLVLMTSFVPDYLSLWKARWLLRIARTKSGLGLVFLVGADVLASLVISFAFFIAAGIALQPLIDKWLNEHIFLRGPTLHDPLYP
jgi:hypothetical protein